MVGKAGEPNRLKSHRSSGEIAREHVNNGPNPSILTERGQAKKAGKEDKKDKD